MKNTKILIVEDETIIANEVEINLQNLGYEVTSIVDTGKKAIEAAKTEKPDIILMDIQIDGEMNGIDIAELIVNRFEIPVIFTTAYLDKLRIGRSKISMPFGYLLKPIHERDLKIMLEMILLIKEVGVKKRYLVRDVPQNKTSPQTIYYQDPFHVWTFNGKYFDYLNEAWYQYTGLDRTLALTLDGWENLIHPDDKEKVREKWDHAWEKKIAFTILLRLLGGDDRYQLFQWAGIPVFNGKNDLLIA